MVQDEAVSKTVHTSRNMSNITLELTSTFSLCTCHDPQQASIGYMADVPPTPIYEPKDLAENDDLCVKPLFFHRPSITSTYDSAESIATPPS